MLRTFADRYTNPNRQRGRATGLSLLALRVSVVSAAIAVIASSAFAQLPVAGLNSISPAGSKAGGASEVKITGNNLDDVDKLLFSHDGITATAKIEPPGDFSKQAQPVPDTFTVKVAGNVPPGLYEVRAIGRYGMTNPRTFHVSSLSEVNAENGNNSADKAIEVKTGSIVNGQADNDAIDYYKIHAAKGQRLLVDCWAQRIDSRMNASLVLYDAAGRELRRVHNTEGLDPVLELNAPADGDYVLGVYDFTYGGGADFFYRLAVHNGPYIDFIYPPVGQPGASGKFTLYGRNLPGGKPAGDMTVSGSPLEQVEANITLPGDPMSIQRLGLASITAPYAGVVESMSYQLNSPQGASNAVDIGYASAPVILEQGNNDDSSQPQPVNVPCEYVGQFYPRGDRDWVQFEAKAGDVLWIEVLSHRLGLPTDPVLTIEQVTKNDQGEVMVNNIATNDDFDPPQRNNTPQMFSMNNRDPRHRFEAKADGTYRVGVSDLYSDSRGDPRMVYRLVIRKAQPDFQVLVFNSGRSTNNQYEAAGMSLRRGETQGLTVKLVRRDGFEGEVEIAVDGIPKGVTSSGAVLGGKSDSAQLLLTADANAPAFAGTIRVIGKAKIDGKDIVREARTGALIWGSKNIQQETPVARMTRDIGLSVVDKETAPATVTAGDGKVIETSLGGKIDLPIKVARHGDFKAAIKLKAAGIPKDTQAKEANITAGDGKMEISFANNRIEPGSYTVYLTGPAKFKYEGNQDAIKTAEARQKELDEILKAFAEQSKQAAEKAKQARDAANKSKEDKGLADAAQKAEDEAKQIEDKRKQAENLKKQADQNLNNVKNANKPKDINYEVNSTPVLIRLAATPFSVSGTSPGAKKQGEKCEIPVTVERKYGFDDAVEVTFEPPKGVAGVSAAKLTISKGASGGKLEITLNDNATVGQHEFTIRGRVKFNNVQLDETAAVALNIEEKPKAE